MDILKRKQIFPDGDKGAEEMKRSIERHKSRLQKAKIPYKEFVTKSKTKFIPTKPGWEKFSFEFVLKGFSNRELLFIQKVKRHFAGLERPERLRPYGTGTTYWGNVGGLEIGDYPGYVEIDVNSCYWEVAKQLGYLTEELYLEGKDETKVRKKLRLVSLGALAKKVIVFEYDRDGELIDISEDICDEEIFWDNITYRFSLTMEAIKKAFYRDVLGYWVDAFFVKKDAAPLVQLAFMQEGYETKIENWDLIQVLPGTKEDRCFIRRKRGEEIKDLPEFRTDGNRGGSVKNAIMQLKMKFEQRHKKD